MMPCTAHYVNCWPPSKVCFAKGEMTLAVPLMGKVHGCYSANVKLILTGHMPANWEGPPGCPYITIMNDLRIAKGHELQKL